MATIVPHRMALAAALLAASPAIVGPATAQDAACPIARAELAAFDRTAGGGVIGRIQRRGDVDRLVAYYHAAGCAGPSLPFLSSRPPQCGQIEAQINRLQAESGAGSPDRARRAELIAAVDRHCNPASPLTAASRATEDRSYPSSRAVIDEHEQPREEQPRPLGLGRAMCVRTCDGFYFPLSAAPGGREGADEMCQALCPAAEVRAFFVDNGSIDRATDGRGVRYASIPNAYKFRREISQSCSCRKPGQTWSSALRRAGELLPAESSDVTITESNREGPNVPLALRPSASVDAPKKAKGKHEQAIDPEPLQLDPEPLPPEPSGMATMRPLVAPAPFVSAGRAPVEPAPTVATEVSRKPAVRHVGPPVNSDPGRPTPIAGKPGQNGQANPTN